MKLPIGKTKQIDRNIFARGTRKGIRYGISFVDPDGKRRRLIVGTTITAAREALATVRADISRGQFRLPSRRRTPRFSDFSDRYLAHAKATKKSWSIDEERLQHLKPFFGKKRMGAITTWNVEQYKAHRKEAASPRTVNMELSILRRMFNLAIEWGFTMKNPVSTVKMLRDPEKPIRVVSAAEEKRLLSAAPDHLKDIIVLALNTGLRRGEILGLRSEHCDLEERVLTVAVSKSGKVRHVPLNAAALKVVRRRVEGRDHLFTWHGKPIADFHKVWRRVVKEARINGIRFHDLRHTFATRAVLAGADLRSLQDVLGHASLRMTMRYSHPSPESSRRVVDLVGASKVAQKVAPAKKKGHGAKP